MKKVYISGKITGLCINEAQRLFDSAELWLKQNHDCDVVNPLAEVLSEDCVEWIDYMVEDLRLLNDCDAIYMLNNWESSKGARIELAFATNLGKEVIFEK